MLHCFLSFPDVIFSIPRSDGLNNYNGAASVFPSSELDDIAALSISQTVRGNQVHYYTLIASHSLVSCGHHEWSSCTLPTAWPSCVIAAVFGGIVFLMVLIVLIVLTVLSLNPGSQ